MQHWTSSRCEPGLNCTWYDAQALQRAASEDRHPLTLFSPAVFRQALRRAGNVVQPEEIEELLMYAIRDLSSYADLNELYLVLLRDGSVCQICYDPDGCKEQHYFTYNSDQTEDLLCLMLNNEHRQVLDSHGWREIAK